MDKEYMIYGGIIGDMIGSVYEWNPCLKDKVKTFKLWYGNPLAHKEGQPRCGSRFTDDTICLLAVMKAICELESTDDEYVKNRVISELKELCPDYEWTGFGDSFWIWVTTKYVKPYNSYGNGSAMRVAAAGLVGVSLEDTRRYARLSAEVTHNHPEGMKGAEAVAATMFLAREGCKKEVIRKYIETEFGYDLHRKLDDIRPGYKFDVSCQGSVPESILCFLEGNSYEECVRLAVSLGGDTDTMGCIAGSIAGSIAACRYPIPKTMILQAYLRLDRRLRKYLKVWKKWAKSNQLSEKD